MLGVKFFLILFILKKVIYKKNFVQIYDYILVLMNFFIVSVTSGLLKTFISDEIVHVHWKPTDPVSLLINVLLNYSN